MLDAATEQAASKLRPSVQNGCFIGEAIFNSVWNLNTTSQQLIEEELIE